jgi:pimeloyl-ACP methyl ester carboxylesterase
MLLGHHGSFYLKKENFLTAPSIYKSFAGEQTVMAIYDSLLARWPVPYASLNVPTRHGSAFVIASGRETAPPLVLLHGAGTNSAIWAGDVTEYSRHYRVLAVDLLGEPGKSAPNRPSWESPAYAEWLDDILNELGVKAVTIMGLSQGAWTALKFAIYKPDRVKALALLSPGGITHDKLSFVVRAIPLLLLGRWGITCINHMVLGGQSVPAEIEEAMTVFMMHFRPRAGALPIFSDAELQRLLMPVLLLMGARDALRDAKKITARLQKLVPHMAATTIPEAGHAIVNAKIYTLPFLTASSLGPNC